MLGKQFSSFLANLPPPVLDRYVANWSSFKELKCIGKDDIYGKNIIKFGERVRTIWHYQLINENNFNSYAFYMTADNKIAAITKWIE